MGAGLFWAAAVAWAFGIAGIVMWYFWNDLANPATNLNAVTQYQNDAGLSIAIGIAGVIFGVTLIIMALHDP